MNVSLTPLLEKWVQEKVNRGLYRSASEVVRQALRVMREQEHVRCLRQWELAEKIAVGIEQLDRSEGRVFDHAVVEDIKTRGRQARSQGA